MNNVDNSESLWLESLSEPREFTITRKMGFLIFLRRGIGIWVVCALIPLVLVCYDYWLYGSDIFQVSRYTNYALLCAIAWIGYPAILFFLAWRRIKIYPLYGIPVIYSVRPDGLTAKNELAESDLAWERYLSWKEFSSYFLLGDGAMQNIWPKAIYSEEELVVLRGLFKRNILSAKARKQKKS